ncbi:MAG: hypothetical protein ACFFCS_27825 [Candidatus Hodarchaeota archaeon]
MVSFELLSGHDNWNEEDDLLDLKGNVQVTINGEQLPSKFFPDGLEIQVYETSFEFIDLLGNMLNHFKDENSGKTAATFQAEFCYTGTYLGTTIQGPESIDVSLLFNPAVVDDEKLLEGKQFKENASLFTFATEILGFCIGIVDSILEFKPSLEKKLEELQIAILDYTEILEKDFNVQIFPQEEES